MKGENINLTFGMNKIYNNACFNIENKDRVGIVGVNGAGKTTLFNVILKKIKLDSGRIVIPKDYRIGYLPQEIELDDLELNVFDYLLSARPIKELEKKLEKLYIDVSIAEEKKQQKILKEISNTQEKLEYYDCYNAENTLFEIIEKMSIPLELLDMKLMNLSGGQKSKIAFAHLIYSNPEILLLDEPTNHLDATTREYIEGYIKKYKGMVLVISHDVDFLNKIVNKIMYVNKTTKQITMYNGNYNEYLKKHKQEQEIEEKLIEKQEQEIETLKAFIDKAKKASRTNHNIKKMGKDREIKLEKKLSELHVREKKYSKLKLNIKPLREGSRIPLKVNNIKFKYEEKDYLYKNLSFVINNKERFLIIGENGVGKSTLLKLLIGKYKPEEGNIWYGNKTDIAYYAQELELLELSKTIIENVDTKGYSDKELRTILGSFLFYGDDVFKKIEVLSPGEKARVALCKIMLERANLLLLDEPTNHLDPDTQKVIGENFKNYEGTIIMVSHNIPFIESINVDRILLLPSGKIINYDKERLEKYIHNTNNN